jgi:hypothetical protein
VIEKTGDVVLKRTFAAFLLSTFFSILLGSLFCCNPIQADSTVFSDSFDDGDISDWTVTTTGTAVFEVSTDASVSSPYSTHMKSLTNSKAMGVSPSYTLDLTRDYRVLLYFRIPDTDNHWFEVFNNHQIYLIIDYYDDLDYYNGTKDHLILELNTNQWYKIEIKAYPSSSSYDVYIDDEFKKTCSMWIHTGFENSFRIGDRADGSTDKGEAYWDDICIYQTSESPPPVPEGNLSVFLVLGGAIVLIYLWKTLSRNRNNTVEELGL